MDDDWLKVLSNLGLAQMNSFLLFGVKLTVCIIVYSEWNSSIKEKWNAKSIYVVGKATAALGKLLRHLETFIQEYYFKWV